MIGTRSLTILRPLDPRSKPDTRPEGGVVLFLPFHLSLGTHRPLSRRSTPLLESGIGRSFEGIILCNFVLGGGGLSSSGSGRFGFGIGSCSAGPRLFPLAGMLGLASPPSWTILATGNSSISPPPSMILSIGNSSHYFTSSDSLARPTQHLNSHDSA